MTSHAFLNFISPPLEAHCYICSPIKFYQQRSEGGAIVSVKMIYVKLRCDEHFTHAFTACNCVFKEITLVGSNQGYYFENATACSKRTLKTTVATQLYVANLK